MNDQVLVSIVIAAHSPELFGQALSSALGQDHPHVQVVVCDDSKDQRVRETFESLTAHSEMSCVYLRNERNLGFARSVERCVEHATGAFTKILCDDDLLVSSCASRQASVLYRHHAVSMVSNQRLLCDINNALLPSRATNFAISPGSAILHGNDLLEVMAESALNPLGGISHAMFRTDMIKTFLSALVREGQGFSARLDTALYLCALRRGHLAYLEDILSLERLHAGQFSHLAGTILAYRAETQWLLQMLAERGNEPAPAKGWVRYQSLADEHCDGEYVWDEFELARIHTVQAAECHQQVGTTAMTFAQVYDEWLSCRTLSDGQMRVLQKRIARWTKRPKIVPVILAPVLDELGLKVTLNSLRAQSYEPEHIWVLCSEDAGWSKPDDSSVTSIDYRGDPYSQVNQIVNDLESDTWILLLHVADRMQAHGLLVLADWIAVQKNRTCFYMDEGSYDDLQSLSPIFKPDFNLDLMRSFPYVGRLLAFECRSVREVGGLNDRYDGLSPHDLLWRLVEAGGSEVVGHIPEILVECKDGFNDFLSDSRLHVQAARVVQKHLERSGIAARVSANPATLISRIAYTLQHTPSVSLLIHAGNDLGALSRCIMSVLERTQYVHYDIILIANGTEPDDVREWLSEMQACGSAQLSIVSVVSCDRAKGFNEAALLAGGELLVLFDVMCVVIDAHWLHELVSQACRTEVGVVGPMICDRYGKVRSAGLVLGMQGGSGTAFKGYATDTAGYLNRLQVVQNWSAVGLECLLIRRQLFLSLEGLEADKLTGVFLDVDLCLRVKEQGYLITWTPFARIACFADTIADYASERSRVLDREYLHERWVAQLSNDPAFNPNFSLKLGGFQMEPGKKNGWNPFVEPVLPSVMAAPINMGAVGHYRIVLPFNELEKAGWIQGGLYFGNPETIDIARQKPDAVILQCRYGVSAIDDFKTVRRCSDARLIYELDDYIIDVPKKNAHARNLPTNMRELVRLGIAMSDRVVVSTQPLADALSGMHGDIRVVPNMLAASLWSQLKSERNTSRKPRVGWAGGTSHRGDLELILDVVKALANDVDWIFFGMCPDLLRPYIKEFHEPVSLGAYPRKLASLNLDLALAPLEINLFNDCKSNLRLLEYGACGFPVVCTNTKAYQGYLPCTRVSTNQTHEWIEAIRMHLNDREASARQGDALREVVLRDYVLTSGNLQLWANAWLAD